MDIDIGNDKPFFLIAGPCQIESKEHALHMATEIKKITDYMGIELIYKSSFDKANRTSIHGKRGAGLDEGMKICLLYTSPSPRDLSTSRMPSSA